MCDLLIDVGFCVGLMFVLGLSVIVMYMNPHTYQVGACILSFVGLVWCFR